MPGRRTTIAVSRTEPAAGDGEVSPPICCFQALENGPHLQADADEGQDVQREHDGSRTRHRFGLSMPERFTM